MTHLRWFLGHMGGFGCLRTHYYAPDHFLALVLVLALALVDLLVFALDLVLVLAFVLVLDLVVLVLVLPRTQCHILARFRFLARCLAVLSLCCVGAAIGQCSSSGSPHCH